MKAVDVLALLYRQDTVPGVLPPQAMPSARKLAKRGLIALQGRNSNGDNTALIRLAGREKLQHLAPDLFADWQSPPRGAVAWLRDGIRETLRRERETRALVGCEGPGVMGGRLIRCLFDLAELRAFDRRLPPCGPDAEESALVYELQRLSAEERGVCMGCERPLSEECDCMDIPF